MGKAIKYLVLLAVIVISAFSIYHVVNNRRHAAEPQGD